MSSGSQQVFTIQDWGGDWKYLEEDSRSLLQQFGKELNWLVPDSEDSFDVAGLDKANLNLFSPAYALKASKIIHHRKSPGHLIPYIDAVELVDGVQWGNSLLSSSFANLFFSIKKSRRFKGPVIFLGYSPKIPVFIEVLAGLGLQDFSVMASKAEFETLQGLERSFIGIKLERLESTNLIQSPAEYCLCFVMVAEFSEEILSDMSYFHFLSPDSLVFISVLKTNFQYADVKALGNQVIDAVGLHDEKKKVFLEFLKQMLSS